MRAQPYIVLALSAVLLAACCEKRAAAAADDKIEALYKLGARGGEGEEFGTARYHRETAEIALVEACIAGDQPYPAFDAAFELPARPDPFDP